MSKEGVVRADFKTKEVIILTLTEKSCFTKHNDKDSLCNNVSIFSRNFLNSAKFSSYIMVYSWIQILDVWPYKVLKNWGYTENTFILEFDDRTYPLKTPQGRWMNALVDFHIEAILGDMVRGLIPIP